MIAILVNSSAEFNFSYITKYYFMWYASKYIFDWSGHINFGHMNLVGTG